MPHERLMDEPACTLEQKESDDTARPSDRVRRIRAHERPMIPKREEVTHKLHLKLLAEMMETTVEGGQTGCEPDISGYHVLAQPLYPKLY